MNEGVQLSLKLKRPASFRREDFVVSPTNEAAVRALDAWPDWLGGALALVGPEGAGKTHLARDWAERTGAAVLRPQDAGQVDLAGLEGRPVLVDDAEGLDDETLFHLINLAALPGGGLLLTARRAPAAWDCALPDLRSRLNALRVVELGGPDDAVLRGVLLRFFEQSSIRPSEDLLAYLVRRIERAVPKAREVVAQLEEAAGPELRPVTRALAREILDAEPDLFD
ncbi:chromosomal replication initiator DnaA [Caulobacter sp. 17J80-11]|uniref:chromosomal replication initiator DnaA n=1 Tax=Caulobacter sp. 17J80-11 TaxID=2763502 RepID=UPI00351C2489